MRTVLRLMYSEPAIVETRCPVTSLLRTSFSLEERLEILFTTSCGKGPSVTSTTPARCREAEISNKTVDNEIVAAVNELLGNNPLDSDTPE